MEFPRTEKLAVLKRVLDNHEADTFDTPARAPIATTRSQEGPTLDRIEADGRWLLGCLGVENPTNAELRELGFIQ